MGLPKIIFLLLLANHHHSLIKRQHLKAECQTPAWSFFLFVFFFCFCFFSFFWQRKFLNRAVCSISAKSWGSFLFYLEETTRRLVIFFVFFCCYFCLFFSILFCFFCLFVLNRGMVFLRTMLLDSGQDRKTKEHGQCCSLSQR